MTVMQEGIEEGCAHFSDPVSVVLHDDKLFESWRDGMILVWDAAGQLPINAENRTSQNATKTGNSGDRIENGKISKRVVRPGGLELPTFWFVARRSIQLSYGRTVMKCTVSSLR